MFSRNNIPETEDRVYVIHPNDEESKGTRWVSLFCDINKAVYFDSFGMEYIPQVVLNKIRDKPITHDIFTIGDNESIMSGFYCIAFIEYMLSGKDLLDDTILLSPNG